jgi:hypothetical protein
MPDQKISALTALSAVDSDDLLAVVDSSAATTKKATKAVLFTDPTFTGNVVVPAGDAAGEAAQISAYDATTGRLAIGGIEMGDTGWRDITALQVNGWAFTTIQLHRNGSHCTLRGVWPITADDGKTSDTFYTLPSGYRSSLLLDQPVRNPSTVAGPFIRINVAGSLQALSPSSASTVYFSITWVTTDPWPSTLPGTAI